MEFISFSEEESDHQDQSHAQYKPHDGCCCRGASNFMEVIKSSLRSLIKEEVEDVIRRVILPRLPSAADSTPPAISRTVPHQTEPSASKRLYLRIDDTSLPDTLFTMNKIQHQVDSLKVELVDNLGYRVENDPASSAKIRIVVLNGDLEVEDNDCSEEDFNKNLVRPRKDKASSLLRGKCEILLSRGVANVVDISFTDNSKRNGTFRLGAEVIKSPPGVNIKAAVSKPFAVKERRLLTDRKHEKPSLEDELWRLKNIRRDGPVYQRAKQANVSTVKDFLQLLRTDSKRLQNILDVPETKWKEIVENANACVLTNDLYRYYDNATGVELLLNCAFDIVTASFGDQILQLDESMNDYEKQVINKARQAAHENRHELEPYTSTNQVQSQAESSCIYHTPSTNMRHYEATSIEIQAQVPCLPSKSSMYIQHPHAALVQRGEPMVHAYSYFNSSPSNHFNGGDPHLGIAEGDLLNDPELINQMMAVLTSTPEAPTENNPTRKLITACYVTKAATMFMVAMNQDHSPLKKKRKFD